MVNLLRTNPCRTTLGSSRANMGCTRFLLNHGRPVSLRDPPLHTVPRHTAKGELLHRLALAGAKTRRSVPVNSYVGTARGAAALVVGIYTPNAQPAAYQYPVPAAVPLGSRESPQTSAAKQWSATISVRKLISQLSHVHRKIRRL